jgi:hypothetical protein
MGFCKEKGLHYISDEVFALSAFRRDADEKFTSALVLVSDDEVSPMNPSQVYVIYRISKDFGAAVTRMVSHCQFASPGFSCPSTISSPTCLLVKVLLPVFKSTPDISLLTNN